MAALVAIIPDHPKHGVDHITDSLISDGPWSDYEPHAAQPAANKSPEDAVDLEDVDESPPQHPISAMQEAFEESIMESEEMATRRRQPTLDVQERRRQLLQDDNVNPRYSSRWRQPADARFHPLWKVVAQISFGVHLLHKGLAKSELEVVKILQTHIDEVDSFAEETQDDFDLAINDIEERIDCLEVPLQHSREFNRMLCDKEFRTSILRNNDVIERIIDRTRRAMDHSLVNVKQGQDAVAELARYLNKLGPEWPNHNDDLIGAYETMRGNAQGWLRCFELLQARGQDLTKLMYSLQCIVDEMAKRCGIASRRHTPTGVVGRRSIHQQPSRYSTDSTRSFEKPLPAIPQLSLVEDKTTGRPLTIYSIAEHSERSSLQQPRAPPIVPQEPVMSTSRLAAIAPLRVVPPLRVVTQSEAPRPVSIVIPSRKPQIPSRSPERTLGSSHTKASSSAHDSAYASCPGTPFQQYVTPKRSTDSGSSPASSIVSTPKQSISQSRPQALTPILTRPGLGDGMDSRRPSITALPVIHSGIKSIQSIKQAPPAERKHSLSTVKRLFGMKEKRQSLVSMPGGFF